MLSNNVILDPNLPRPSFSELMANGFASIVSGYYPENDSAFQDYFVPFIQSAHSHGFTVIMMANRIDVNGVHRIAAADAIKEVKAGVDIINFDEPFDELYNLQPSDLNAIMLLVLAVTPNMRFIINEWREDRIREAYQAFGANGTVDVAEDNYAQMDMISLNIQLAAAYHKEPYVWMRFIPRSGTINNSYLNLEAWINSGHATPLWWSWKEFLCAGPEERESHHSSGIGGREKLLTNKA